MSGLAILLAPRGSFPPKALLEVTPPELLVEVPKSRKPDAQSAGSRVMFEQEADFLVRDLKAVEDSYGTDILLPSYGVVQIRSTAIRE